MRQALGALWLAAIAAIAVTASADVLETRDGQTLHGRFRGASEEVVKFESGEELHLIPLSKVASLRFEEAAPPSAPSEAAASEPSRPAATPPPPPAAQPAGPAPRAPLAPTETPAAPAPAPAEQPPPAAAPIVQKVVLPAGTRLRVRLADSIDPRMSAEGDRFSALLESPIVAGDLTIAPPRSKVYGVVTAASTTGPIANRLQLELTQLQIKGKRLAIVTGTQQAVPEDPTGPDTPADAAPTTARTARVASGTLLEFRLLQPLEMQLLREER